ncbi:MAG: hypothetical protein H7174_00040 [Flavobacterium sp.]|nr:hypothetical protein [Flavobacterium sp.]
MKKTILILLMFIGFNTSAQEHFSGISTSRRVGIINASMNPAELVNLSGKFEANIFATSVNVANNKIGFKDILAGDDLKKALFKGTDPANFKTDVEVYGPSFAVNLKKWAFGITTKMNARLDVVDVNTQLADAIINKNVLGLLSTSTYNNDYNQRVAATTWGELGLTAATNIINTDKHRFNAGVTFKFLFPGSYANFGLDKFAGDLNIIGTKNYINNATAGLNVAYSGGLANSFTNFGDYTKALIGGLNGFAGDIGVNYQLKDKNSSAKNAYKLNLGASIRNVGSMTFKDSNNYATTYKLNINSTIASPNGQDLDDFNNVKNLGDVENVLKNNGYLNIVPVQNKFDVKLPTVFSGYADVKIIYKFFLTGFVQRKMNSNNNNEQITSQNIITLTPRFSTKYVEVFLPISNSDIAGSTTGFGLRLGGFFISSNSILSALTSDSKQADFNTGFRWSFL